MVVVTVGLFVMMSWVLVLGLMRAAARADQQMERALAELAAAEREVQKDPKETVIEW